MKRRISLLCCALLLFCTCVFNNNIAFANTREYNPDALKEVYELYDWSEPFLEILEKEESFSYRSIAAFYEENKFMNLATNVSAAILGQSVSEDEYVEMLSEIMILNQYTISEQIAKYGSYNTTKGFVDFVNDAADITFSLEDIVESFSFDDETVKFIYDSLKLGQKLDSKITEFDEITEDGKKYYQALVEDYAFSNQFLKTIVQYEENGKYYNYAYGTTNYDDAISQYSKVEKVTFKRYAAEDRNAIEEGEGTQETSVSGENVTVKFDNWYEGSTEYGRLYGIDDAGNTLWEYTPKAGIAAELSHYIDIGRCKDRYYFNEDQIIYCFNVYTGEILWTNSDASFGVTMFDENGSGSLYVASWYENTLCIISSDGTTLAKIDNLKPDGLDSDSVPSSMRLVDNQTLEVTYWNGEVIYVDLSNYIRLG